jgi:hypothetical protein
LVLNVQLRSVPTAVIRLREEDFHQTQMGLRGRSYG